MGFECETCGAHPKDGTPTFRTAGPGSPMRCREHLEQSPPKDVDYIVRIIEEAAPGGKGE